jgi:hypothetical protein
MLHNFVTLSVICPQNIISIFSKQELEKSHKILINKCKKKSKAIPLQAWTGPEGSRRLRLTDFKTIGT